MRTGRRSAGHVVVAGAVLVCVASAAWANVYPSGVRTDATAFDQTCGTVNVSYILNENANGTATLPGVKIEVLDQANVVVRTVAIPRQTKGRHTYVWDGRDDAGNALPNGSYKVRVTAADFGYTSWTRTSDTTNPLVKFFVPVGVDVNKNPASPYYGRIYVSEGQGGTTTVGPPGRVTQDGLYALEADLTDATGYGDASYTGGVAWNVETPGTTYGATSPFKVTVGEDDYVYLADFSDSHGGLWRYDPNLTQPAVQVLDGIGQGTTHGSITSVIATGTGAATSVVTMDEDLESNGAAGGAMFRYNIGTGPFPFVGFSNREANLFAPTQYALNSLQDIVRHSNGRYYWVQYRAAASRSFTVFTAAPGAGPSDPVGPVTIHTTINGALYYNGIAIDEARDRILLSARQGRFDVRPISAPAEVAQVSVPGTSNRDIAVDAAGNVYLVNSSQERLWVYSPPDGPNSMSTTSGEFVLNKTANGALITAQPQDVNTFNNGSASFSVTASGSPTYRWMRDGADLSDGGIYSGTGTATLNLTGVTRAADDGATFAVRVCSASGVQVSKTVILNVGVVIIQQPAPTTVVCTGGGATLTVQAQGGGTLSYQWQKFVTPDWVNVADSATISGATTPTLTFTNATAADAGQYRCQITDSGDPANPVVTATATVTISAGPTQVGISGNKTVNPGGAASFECTMVGTGPLTYRWYWSKDGVETLIAQGLNLNTLNWTNIPCTANNADVFCRVTDNCGTRESTPKAKIFVTLPAEICDNGLDDDCDGKADCDDSDCTLDFACNKCNDPFADWDKDGDVDMLDFADLQRCMALNAVGYDQACACFDQNNDGSIDEDDVTTFVACGSGPHNPADPACDNLPSGAGKVVINEVTYNVVNAVGTDIADLFEFIELYNRTSAPVDISGWVVRCNSGSTSRRFTLPGGPGSGTTLLGPGGYYVVTSPNVSTPPANPPQLYVEILSSAEGTDFLGNGVGSIELLDGNREPADVLVYNRRSGAIAVAGAEGAVWGDMLSVDLTEPLSLSRWFDGRDTDNNGRDFGLRPRTAGSSNQGASTVVTSYVLPAIDSETVGSTVANLRYSYQPAFVIDPANNTSQVGGKVINPSIIPASPQGGKAVVVWDHIAGGGNMALSDSLMNGNAGYDLYVYFDTSFAGWGQDTGRESISYGVLGTTDTGYNTPDPDGSIFGTADTASGNTGLCWIYNKVKTGTASTCKLYLVDAGPGGDSTPPNSTWGVRHTIDMTGMASGWYRLNLSYNGTTGAVVATGAGQTVNFSTVPGLAGGFYVGYREFAGTTADPVPAYLRPATFDSAQ